MEFDEALKRIEGLEKMSDLKEEDFAPQGGIADVFAQTVTYNRVKTTQIRRYFNTVKKIEADMKKKKGWDAVKTDFYMLTPKLAYARGRALISDEYFKFIAACLKKVDMGDDKAKVENLLKFATLFEAIVSYHKYHEVKGENRQLDRRGGRRR